jgi:hypothetical protein
MRALFLIPGGRSQQLQSFAAVAAVADQLGAEVQVVCPLAAVPLWSLHPGVHRAMPFAYDQATLADWANLMGSVREPDFQVCLNLAPSRQMDLMLSMSHIPTRVATAGFSATEQITPVAGGWPNQALEAFLQPIGVRLDADAFRLPLAPADLQRIVRLQLAELARLLAEQHLELEVPEPVVQALAEQGYEPEYGARPLRRVLRRQLENPLATELLAERFSGARGVRVEPGPPLTFVPLG